MKILYYSPHVQINMAAPSGPGTHIREVIHGFESAGHEVIRLIAGGEKLEPSSRIVVKSRWWKKFVPSIIWESLKDYSLLRLDKKLQAQLESLIEKEKPDVIYERSYYMMGSGFRAAKKFSIRFCCEMNAPYPEEKSDMSGKSIFFRRAVKNEKEQVNTAHKIFVVSTALKTYLESRTNNNSAKIIVTPNAVNPAHINTTEEKSQAIRQRLDIDNDAKVIGFVGSIFPYHGVDLLIEAFAVIQKNPDINIHLLIVGDGEILNELKSRTRELTIDHLVHFTGNIPHKDVYDHIAVMDITVMARSNWYGSPVKIFEYGIMKKCIIAPDVIPVTDVMKNGEDGLLINDNVESVKNAIMFLLSHSDEAKKMATNFHHKVSTEHTWQHVCKKILHEIQ